MIAALRQLAARIRAFFHTRTLDLDFDQEWASHVDMLTDEHIRRGMAPDDARRAAMVRLGGAASLREQHRAVRGLPLLDSILQDLRFSLRLIAKERWFSAAAIAALALGIGVNAIGFTIVNGAFLRGLPFDDADRLYLISSLNRSGRGRGVSHADLLDWRARTRAFPALAAFNNTSMNISDGRALPEELRGTWITANTCAVLRQPPLLGRDFTEADDRPGAEPVALLSYRVWKNRYGGDPSVLGQPVRLNGEPFTIVGIMPDGMNFPNNTEVWTPFRPTEAQRRRDTRVLSVFGRLSDASSRAEAQTEMNGIAQQLALAYPETNKEVVGAGLQTFTERYVGGPARTIFLTVMGAVSFVLLIACANVANLVLSRSAHRARELAVRVALGATRGRIVRQLLIESVVLGCIGGSIGLLIAVAGVHAVDAAVQDPDKPYWIAFTIDYTVIAYVAGICVLTGILFGLAPALHVSRGDVHHALKDGGRGVSGGRRVQWISGTLVVVELALTIVLLTGAGLMIRSFLKLYRLDTGIRTEHLMAMRMQLPPTKYPSADARRVFYDRLEPRLAAIPGVEAVAVTTAVPPFASGQREIDIEGRPASPPDDPLGVSAVTVSPSFFTTVGVSLLRGRIFQAIDGAPGSETVIINERMAAELFRGEDPIGRRLRFRPREGRPAQAVSSWLTIVGVSPAIRHGAPRRMGRESDRVVYLPHRQEPPAGASLLVRSPLPPGSVMEAVRRAVQSIDQDQPVFTIQTVDQMLAQDRWPFRLFGGLFACLAAIAVLLSSVGLYAVMAYGVSQRTQEIGVRIALGGEARQMYWLILRRAVAQLAIGLTIGLAGALGMSQVLRGVVVEIAPTDPVTYVGTVVVLVSIAIAASLVPARRATRVDPVVALRAE